MNKRADKKEIYLLPGEFYFGDERDRISTLLGSCIAITLWHPTKLIGGMCHFMLPSPPNRHKNNELDGRYAEDAVAMFLKEIKLAKTLPLEYQVKVFGGGNMLTNEVNTDNCSPSYQSCISGGNCKKISCKNSMIAPFLLQKYGFNITNHDLGGTQHRKVIFEVWSGDVWQRKGGNSHKDF